MADERKERSKFFGLFLSFLSVIAIGYLDYLTGYEVCFTLFYIFPIYYSSWHLGKLQGYIVSVFAGIAWLVSDILAGHTYPNDLIILWNFSMRIAIFVLSAYFLNRTKKLLDKEKELSRIDPITGLNNSRSFYEHLKQEIEKFKRFKHPFSLVYLDIDNFKEINDKSGHLFGDEILKTLADKISENFRSTDIAARMGGDEFCFIFVETPSKQSEEALKRLKELLSKFFNEKGIPISFSFGMVCFENILVSEGPVEIIKLADDLMYSVKKNGKNQIKAVVY